MLSWVLLLLPLSSFALNHPPSPPYETRYFNQSVTHFGGTTRHYQQRYFVSAMHYKPGGPMFFYTGGEATIGYLPYSSGAVLWEFAKEHNGLVVYAEHRYYGVSLPFGASSWTLDNIKYLRIEEALMDYVVLIKYLKQHYKITGPVVSIGGSYPGSLTSYMRMNHPEVVDIGLAASAPILLWPNNGISQYRWFEQVTQSFARKDARCTDLVRDAFIELRELQATKKGQMQVMSDLGLCYPMANTTYLEQFVINAFSGEAMENLPWVNEGVPAFPLDVQCKYMVENTNMTMLQRLKPIVKWSYGDATSKCIDVRRAFLPCADPTGCGTGPEGLSWDYQCCTEEMHPAGSNNVTDMFPPFPYDIPGLDAYCKAKWGTTPSPNHVYDTLVKPHLHSTSRLIFSNGLLDPWHVGGVLHNISSSVVAVLIADGAHHDDLWAVHPNEPPSLTAARLEERRLISQWISDWRKERSAM